MVTLRLFSSRAKYWHGHSWEILGRMSQNPIQDWVVEGGGGCRGSPSTLSSASLLLPQQSKDGRKERSKGRVKKGRNAKQARGEATGEKDQQEM